MGLLDCEIVDGISEEILTFSVTRPRFGIDNKLAFATVLMHKTSRCQACFVVTKIHQIAVSVFSFVNNSIIHSNDPILERQDTRHLATGYSW